MHNLSSNIIKLSNQITSILGFLAFLKLYNIAVIMFVLVNVNLIKVIVTIAHFFRKDSVTFWRVNLTFSLNVLVSKSFSKVGVQ